MVASSALQRPSRNPASTAPSRSPAAIARMISWPVTPMTSLSTLSSCTFICASAFCTWCTARERSPTSSSRWRRYARSGQIASGTRNAPRSRPWLISCRIHWQSLTSLLRPLTCFVARGFTRCTSRPDRSSTSNTGIQYTPVDSIATTSTPHDRSHAAIASRSRVNVPKLRTGSSNRSASTAT